MAPRKSDPAFGEKHGRIKFMFFELEGSNETLQEAIQSINAVVSRAVNGNSVPPAAKQAALPSGSSSVPAMSNGGGDGAASHDVIDLDADDQEAEEAAPQRQRAPRKGVTPPIAIPFDMETPMSLVDYVAQFKLENDQERYLALAGWLRTHRSGAPLKAGLILTLYGKLDWRTQVDVTMPLRRLASKKFQWLERTGAGEYQIAQMGETKLAKLKAA